MESRFRPLHSTLTAMLDATDEWYTNMDSGLITAILFINLKKAFKKPLIMIYYCRSGLVMGSIVKQLTSSKIVFLIARN